MTAIHRPCTFTLLLLLAGAVPCFAQGVSWRTDYTKAVAESSQSGKPLFIDVGSENCYWCKQLEQRTFTDEGIIKLLNERFVPLKVNGTNNATLVQALRIQSYPTLVFAGSDGSINAYKEGFLEAAPLKEQLLKVLTAVGTPDWMTRDYSAAIKAVEDNDPARAVSLLRGVVEDGKERPVQTRARKLMGQLEAKADESAKAAAELVTKGKTQEAVAAYTKLTKDYPGTPAARQGRQALMKLASRGEPTEEDRKRQADDLLTQARQDYKQQRYLICLDRCELLLESYSDLAQSKDASKLAEQIKDNPEWARKASDQLSERLAVLYLALADSWLKKGQPQQAIFYLDRIVKLMPNSQQAEQAQSRLTRLRGSPELKK